MIGIIAAMDEEINALKELMQDVKESKMLSKQFFIGKLANKDVVLIKSGVGKVAASITCGIILNNYDVEYIINIGSAGSLTLDMPIESIIIPPVLGYHDLDVYDDNWPKNFKDENHTFYADKKLLEIAYKLKDENTYFKPHVSGDMFVFLDSQIEKIKREFPDAYSAEMEACAIAETCKVYNIPFIIIRSISDVVVEKDSQIDFDTYLINASKKSALYCQRFINEANHEY